MQIHLRDTLAWIAVISVGISLYLTAVKHDSNTHWYDELFILYIIGIFAFFYIRMKMRR